MLHVSCKKGMFTHKVNKDDAMHSVNFLMWLCNTASHLMHRPLVPSYGIHIYCTRGPFSLSSGLRYSEHAMLVCWASVICVLWGVFLASNQDNNLNDKDKVPLDEESCCYAGSGVAFTHEFMLLNVLSQRKKQQWQRSDAHIDF